MQSSSETRSLALSVLSTVGSRGITAAGSFVLSLLLARQLSIGDFGRISFCLTLLVALTMISRFGFDFSLLRFAGAAWHAGDRGRYAHICRFALQRTGGISLLLTVLVMLGLSIAWSMGWQTAETMLWMTSGLLPVTLVYVVSSCFKSAHRPQIGALFEIGSISLLSCVFLSALYFLRVPITVELATATFLIASVSVCLIGLLIISYQLRNHGSSTDRAFDAREFLNTSRDFALISNAQVLGNWGGLLLLGIFRDDIEVGYFSAALRTALIPSLLVNIVVSVCSPRLAGLHDAGDIAGFKRVARASSTGIFAVNFPVLVVMAVGCVPLMAMFGPEYAERGYLLAIIALGLMVQTGTALGQAILGMAGKHQLVRSITLVSAMCAVGLAGVLGWWLGALGAAIAFAAYSALHPLVLALIVKREIGFWPVPGDPRRLLQRRLSGRARPNTNSTHTESQSKLVVELPSATDTALGRQGSMAATISEPRG